MRQTQIYRIKAEKDGKIVNLGVVDFEDHGLHGQWKGFGVSVAPQIPLPPHVYRDWLPIALFHLVRQGYSFLDFDIVLPITNVSINKISVDRFLLEAGFHVGIKRPLE